MRRGRGGETGFQKARVGFFIVVDRAKETAVCASEVSGRLRRLGAMVEAAGNPDGNGAAGEQEVATRVDFLPQAPADTQHAGEVQSEDEVIHQSQSQR